MSHHVTLKILTEGSVGARKKRNGTLNHPRYQGISDLSHQALRSMPVSQSVSQSITTADLLSFVYTDRAIKLCQAVPLASNSI